MGPIIAEASMLFGWSVDDIFEMPVARFFCLLSAGRKVKRIQEFSMLSNLCDVSSISLANGDYFLKVKNGFLGAAYKELRADEMPKVPAFVRPAIDSGSDQAKEGLFSMARAMKGFH